MKEITSSQFYIIAVFVTISGKFLTLQPIVFEEAGKDAFWSILFGVVIDFLILTCVFFLLKQNQDKSFFELLKSWFGNIFSKIVLAIFAVFLLFKLLFLSEETFSFFMRFLYDDLSLVIYIIPLVFVTSYFAIKGIKTIARTMEVFALIILIGIVVCSVTATTNFSLDYLTPLFEDGIMPTLKGLVPQMFYGGNALILLFFMGKIDFNAKHFNTKFFAITGIMNILVIFFSLVFFMAYENSAKYVEFSLAYLPQFNPFVSDIGRFNWLSVAVSTIAMLLSSSTIFYCLALILRWIFNLKRSLLPVCIWHVVIIGLAFLSEFSILVMEQKVLGYWKYITGGIGLMFLLLCILFLIFGGKKWTKV